MNPISKKWLNRFLTLFLSVILSLARATETEDLAPLKTEAFRQHSFVVQTADLRKENLQLYWNDDQGRLLRDFTSLENYVKSKGETLLFAANAGMFSPDSKPVGLLVQDGRVTSPLNLNDGYGNFYIKPNGVFLITAKNQAIVVESSTYPELLSTVAWATQSGPLLVQQGTINPNFLPDSKNLKIRSGVGVRNDGIVIFALSKEGVTFYDFALFFKDQLDCPNALYLDGDISAFKTEGEPESPGQHSFGPMFGIVDGRK